MSKISGQLLISGQFQNNCEIPGISGQLQRHLMQDCSLINLHLTRSSRVMSAAASMHVELASSLTDEPTLHDTEIHRVDGSVKQQYATVLHIHTTAFHLKAYFSLIIMG